MLLRLRPNPGKKKYGFKNFAIPYWRYLIPITGSSRWFDGVFQGRYITILSTNYAAVLDKDTNLLWSELQWHRSCHSNEMTPLLPILLADVFLGTPSQELFSPIATSKLERFRFLRALSKGWSFMVRNTVKTGQFLCSAVSCRTESKRFLNAI